MRYEPPLAAGKREHFDLHAGRNNPARHIDNVNGHPRHDGFPYSSKLYRIWLVSPANRSATSISTSVKITINPDTAAVRTSRLVSICCQR